MVFNAWNALHSRELIQEKAIEAGVSGMTLEIQRNFVEPCSILMVVFKHPHGVNKKKEYPWYADPPPSPPVRIAILWKVYSSLSPESGPDEAIAGDRFHARPRPHLPKL